MGGFQINQEIYHKYRGILNTYNNDEYLNKLDRFINIELKFFFCTKTIAC